MTDVERASKRIQEAEARRAGRFLSGILPELETVTATLERSGDTAVLERVSAVRDELLELASDLSGRRTEFG
jgi:hypothetical protein